MEDHNYDEQRYEFMDYPIAPRPNVKQKINLDDPLNQRIKEVGRFSNW